MKGLGQTTDNASGTIGVGLRRHLIADDRLSSLELRELLLHLPLEPVGECGTFRRGHP